MLYSQAWLLNFEMAFALAPRFFWMPPVVILVGYRYPLDFVTKQSSSLPPTDGAIY
jgi:hypothetical protein